MFEQAWLSRAGEHVSVASVEAMLGPDRRRYPATGQGSEGALVTSHALWICACVSTEDAPTWLIYDTAEVGVTWCRVPHEVEPLDLVHACMSVGGHADPDEVLLWLQGRAPDPWAAGGYGDGDAGVVDHLGRRILSS